MQYYRPRRLTLIGLRGEMILRLHIEHTELLGIHSLALAYSDPFTCTLQLGRNFLFAI
jgi:hypothetical protein